MQFGIESERFMAVMGGLFVFGIAYAVLVNRLHHKGYSEGYTAFLVVGGVLVTLLGNIPLHHQDPFIDFLLLLACFAATGLPMVINDWLGYVWARQADQEYLAHVAEEATDGTA